MEPSRRDGDGSSLGSQKTGYVFAIVQAILYATMGVIGKYLYGTGLVPGQVMVLRFCATVMLLGLFLCIWRKQPLFSRRPIVYLQAFFFVVSAFLYLLAVNEMAAGLATVIFYLYPVAVAVIAAAVFRERPSVRIVGALGLATVGVVLISGVLVPDAIQLSIPGVAYSIGSSVTFAVYSVMGQKNVKKDAPLTMTFSISVVGLVMTALVFPGDFAVLGNITLLQGSLGVAIALFNTILPVVLLLAAIARIGATKASLISILETPFSLFFAFIVLGETLTVFQAMGSALVVVAIVVVTLPQRAPAKP